MLNANAKLILVLLYSPSLKIQSLTQWLTSNIKSLASQIDHPLYEMWESNCLDKGISPYVTVSCPNLYQPPSVIILGTLAMLFLATIVRWGNTAPPPPRAPPCTSLLALISPCTYSSWQSKEAHKAAVGCPVELSAILRSPVGLWTGIIPVPYLQR